MSKRYLFFLFVFFILLNSSFAQQKFTISGFVKDSLTGEDLIGATVTIKELSSVGASTNAYGFYSITIPAGNYTFISQFIGYKSKTIHINLKQNIKYNFRLEEQANELKEVIVSGERKDENVSGVQMGVEKIDIKEIKNIPVLFGEKDVLKTLQLTPGVQSAGDGNSGFYVRGGSADQNLILLDEAIVYNASHLFGFFSVFNSDALKDVTLFKGTQPAEYGGRLSSVLDIKMNDGNNQTFGVEGGIGLIASRLKIEGPIKKGKGSFMISGRRTYADLFLKLSRDSTINKSKLYFYDFNVKANYQFDEKNKLYLSGYFGKDVLGLDNLFGLNWGNATGTLRWNHLFNNRLFSNTSLIFSNYDYVINLDITNVKGEIISRIQDYDLKEDLQYYINAHSKLKFGVSSFYHRIIPGVITIERNSSINHMDLTNKNAWENAAYLSHEYKPDSLWSFEYGLRLTSFSLLGPGDFYTYDANGNTLDTTNYNSHQFVKTYLNLEPRLNINYLLTRTSSLKASYTRNVQNLHLISNSTTTNPTDLWIPSSNNVKPEISDQVSLGYFRNFRDNMFEFSTEVYYKNLQNQIDYKNSAQLNFNENVESQLLFGKGRAYGIEFFLKKKYGRFNGWVGYTLSRTEKKIPGINNDNYYPATQDRTHDISIVGMYELSKKLTLSAVWVYYTGNAVTFPSGKYEIDGQVVNYYTERNGYRMPPYNRLDLGLTWIRKKTKKFESSWNFSIYNAYGRQNAYEIIFQQDPNDATKTQAVQISLFRWVPSFTYNFKF